MAESVKSKIENIVNSVKADALKDLSLVQWRKKLAAECQVYVCNQSYIAKRFDEINYEFCSAKTAKEILVDNLYALLRFKYYPVTSDEIDKRIDEIVHSFVSNIKTSILKVDFNQDTDCLPVKWLPDGCIAFKNGVYDFRNNNWLFEYEKVYIKDLMNSIYLYDPSYIITWYVNINFEPIEGIDINTMTYLDMIDLMKVLDKDNRNFCFELMYNMSHDINHQFSPKMFIHLCETMGFLCIQSFIQKFVIFVGNGSNGKNSLIDGCFSSRIIPMPASNSLEAIEEDKFITGALENKAHNIYLETKEGNKSTSEKLKVITGSMYQTIEVKGEPKRSGILNCKILLSANDQEKLKFNDTTTGLRRRINIFEIWYTWDEKKTFMRKGDYYDTTFSEDLHEITGDILNYIIFIYFAMYGIKHATNNFTKQFSFTENDWKLRYSDIDLEFKSKIDQISAEDVYRYLKSVQNQEVGKVCFFSKDNKRLYSSESVAQYGINNYNEYVNKFMSDEATLDSYFLDNEYVYMSIRVLQIISGQMIGDSKTFTQVLKKTYNLTHMKSLYNNQPYIKVAFRRNRLIILN